MRPRANSPDRRHFLRMTAALGGLGAAAPFALQLAAAGSAAGQAAPDYKALVCLFLTGGNDAHNTVLATDAESWTRYWAARNTGDDPIALMPPGTAPTARGQTSPLTGRVADGDAPEAWGGVVPIAPVNNQGRSFALHPFLDPLRPLFAARRLAVVANVGTLIQPTTKAQYRDRSVALPRALFSHNDQQSVWQAGAVEGARVGWGGRMGDLLAGMNGTNTLFTAVSTSGNAVFLSGRSVIQYQLTTAAQPAVLVNGVAASSLFGSSTGPGRLREVIADGALAGDFGADYTDVVERSIASSAVVNSTFARAEVAGVPAPPGFVNPITQTGETNSLAVQLQTVARMIAAAPLFGVRRQVFFVSIGGWDTHDFQNRGQGANLARVGHALAYFDSALGNLAGADKRNAVTLFTASDFGRNFNTNGDGTDHAWGGHHFVMGGAVKGGDIYGRFPVLGMDASGFSNPDMTGAALVPSISVDQYAATLGAWFGLGDGALDDIFPNLRNFPARTLGFL
jgi:uncharacterized protein (DUF1501 family)